MGKIGNKGKKTTNLTETAINQQQITGTTAGYAHTHSVGGYSNTGYTVAPAPGGGYTTAYTTGTTTVPGPGFVQYTTPQQYPIGPQQYPIGTQIPFYTTEDDPAMSPEEREMAIEFLENVMFLLVARLDECDVPNKGGIMDHNEYAPLESVIDLGEYEIVIRPKT